MLINQIHEIIPEIVDGLIFVSKNLHAFSLNIFKNSKQNVNVNVSVYHQNKK
jgi:hypothetical protein